MQNFLKKQLKNETSFDLVTLIFRGISKIKDKMNSSLAADFYDEALETVLELT